MLREACRQAKEWRERCPDDPPPLLCVNLSAKQMQSPGLKEDVSRVLRETGLHPGDLNLEITADALTKDREAMSSRLRELKIRAYGWP